MSRHYSASARESDQYALPDVEVFYMGEQACAQRAADEPDDETWEPGWYYWSCLPGCLPDSDPCGPYATEQAAIDAMREEYAE